MKKLKAPACALLFLCFALVPAAGHADADRVIVHGTGYPPIRAHSRSHAYIMAKRAAVLDAYRNAVKASLSGNGGSGAYDRLYYENLSGFVKGMEIISEEYLSDGGVRIRASVHITDAALQKQTDRTGNGFREPYAERRDGPEKVSIDKWYEIISGTVKFEK